ncbi:prolyl oligopeptidase family serine peptidase [Hymenobacter busanensis]|uniref:Acyl-peptide hydrolase n=1 Tax=Hymenobacter busanensis TaxID=2607656 RepID=A0A7L4ZZE9_9BACT|nr:prolyl oligopeptidase family serine peptidase [Hymenobacter busanensis]KAA9332139.1 prolyl oligopeptidase family serine peptidase [Hymenobacter busanensis]QHJ07522.1 prolyl oligopeptidase family serine peptidase [Hymenobacter busanensis]
MKHLLLPCLTWLVLLTPAAAQVPKSVAPPVIKRYTVEQFLNTTKLNGRTFSPDEQQILFSSNQTGVFNLYTVPVKGGPFTPVTSSTKESIYPAAWLPDGRLVYSHDQGGNENFHLYVREANGQERDLTPGDKLRAEYGGWRRDGKAFYVLTNERDPKFMDLYRYDVPSLQRTLLYQNTQGLDPVVVSSDDKYVALQKSNTTLDSEVLLYRTDTKETTPLSAHKGSMANTPMDFDPKTRYLYATTDDGSEFAYVVRYDLTTGKRETVEKANWDIVYTYFSRAGKYRVTGINEDGRTSIRLYDAANNKPLIMPTPPAGVITGLTFSPSDRRLAYFVNGDRTPSDLYVYDFNTKNATKLTSCLNPAINSFDLVETRTIRYQSFDGMGIPALLYAPHGAKAGGEKLPAVVEVHGGPGGQSTPNYSGLCQYLANNGYVVLRVNNRGSSGYGKTFYAADDQKHGREPLWDCLAAKKYLASLGYVDTSRVAIMGGSYGGYMTLAALAFAPKRFAAGVDIFGVSNWVRTLQSIPPYWESFRQALYQEIGNPDTDMERLKATSPLFHADKIERPLLVIQGENDPRVIKPESDDMVAAIKNKGGTVEYVVFPDEGHGFAKRANEMKAYETTLSFLNKHLQPTP